MTMVYYNEDADIDVLRDTPIGVIGYGSLGRPVALNLRDSGLQVQIGIRPDDDESRRAVEADNIPRGDVADVAQACPVLLMMLPDEVMAQVYLEKISPYLKRGSTLIFASGYNVAFGFIEPPPFVDVGLVAPRTIGAAVREHYLSGEGFYSFVAAGQDASGTIWDTVLAIAKAIGSLHAGAVEITMEQEAELDLFIQQAILPTLHHLLVKSARLLLSRGYPPEAAIMDLYISGEMTDYLQRAADNGLLHALRLSSLTGQYGIFSRLERFDELKLDRLLEMTLEEIRSGEFSKEWAREYADGYPRLRRLLGQQETMDLWELEQQTIDLLHGDW
jgi:ketol-acid reductoisomerase